MGENGQHYVYVLRCADGTFYTGYTTDPDRRCREHNSGDGARYTSGRLPVDLVYTESFDSRSEACAREYEIKQWSHSEKRTLIE